SGLPLANVTVNMVTGNVAMTLAPHTVQSVAGPLGVGLAYNSLGSASRSGGQHGLYAHYYTDDGSHGFVNATGQRLDSTINFAWPTKSPFGGTPSGQGVVAHWTGFITFPAGSWQIGGAANGGGMNIYLDGASSPQFSHWGGGLTTTPSF